jgi:excisionase family DNA binding protein
MEHAIKIRDAAAKLQLSVSTVYRYAEQGKIPCAKVGSCWRFMGSELDRFLTIRQNKENGGK